MAPGLRPPFLILENFNISGNSTCASEVGHQISKESVELLNSRRDLKKSWTAAGLRPPSWILVDLNILGNGTCGSEVVHQISKESVKQF
jgi:hypothetical protein